jgi:hypothetical protein
MIFDPLTICGVISATCLTFYVLYTICRRSS